MKRAFKILVCIFTIFGLLTAIGIGILFIPGVFDKLNDVPENMFISSILDKESSDRSVGEKFFLFHTYVENQDIVKALEMAAELEPHVGDLKVDQRRYIAMQVGQILMAGGEDEDFDMARTACEIFLKDRDPAFYHFFMSLTYMQEGNFDAERRELMKAKEYPLDPKIEEVIEKRLKA